MCGITAIFSYHSDAVPVDEVQLRSVRDAMLSRGPDDAGLWVSDNRKVGLGHRRLSIIGLGDSGRQPMASMEACYRIVFNGEIYNYQILRRQLEEKGYRFFSETDTEVLLNLYAEYSSDMLRYLRGMFAFVIWDENKQAMFLARDPFGVKPLYFSDNGRRIAIASQVKALLKCDSINKKIEPAGHVGYFLLGHVPEPYTLYKGIRSLPAGSYLWVDNSGVSEPSIYYDVKKHLLHAQQQQKNSNKTASFSLLKEAIVDSISSHMIADVPVGVFLSSGIDSALITALASERVSNPLQTVTLGFQEYRHTNNDEIPLAEQVAHQYHTDHHTACLTMDDVAAEMEGLFSAMDQPTIDGINTYFVSKVAAENGLKVALSGIGGDEIFGGYNNFKRIPQFVRWCRWARRVGFLSRLLRRLTQPFFRYLGKEKYAGFLEYANTYSGAYFLFRSLQMPFQIFDVMDANIFLEGWNELCLLDKMKASIDGLTENHLLVSGLELQWYMRNQLLRDTDWAGMAHSLEIRVPYVDVSLFSQVMNRYYYIRSKRECLSQLETSFPQELFHRKKSGFNVPIREWYLKCVGGNNSNRNMRSWADLVYQRFIE